MGWAVILLPDERGDAAARRVWNAARNAGYGEQLDGENRPHVSLMLLETQNGTLEDIVHKFAAETKPAHVAFGTMGSFGEDVIYLEPQPAGALHQMNRALTAALGPMASLVDRHYLPGGWQPHMTVAFDIPEGRFTRAWQAVASGFVPFTTVLRSVAVVKFNPVKVVNVFELMG